MLWHNDNVGNRWQYCHWELATIFVDIIVICNCWQYCYWELATVFVDNICWHYCHLELLTILSLGIGNSICWQYLLTLLSFGIVDNILIGNWQQYLLTIFVDIRVIWNCWQYCGFTYQLLDNICWQYFHWEISTGFTSQFYIHQVVEKLRNW